MATPNLLGAPGVTGSAASLTQKLIVAAELTTTAETTVYTVPTNGAVKLAQASLCNTSGGAVNVSVSLVLSGGTAGVGNRVLSAYPLAAGDTLPLADFLGGHMLGQGDFISVLASVATAVTIVVSAAVVG